MGDWAPGVTRVKDNAAGKDSPVLCNLEGPVFKASTAGCATMRRKAGPHLFHRSLPAVAEGSVFCLANNHAMDFGWNRLRETMQLVEKLGFAHVGAGPLEAGTSLVITEARGVRVGVFGRCESQFGLATKWREGVAALEPMLHQRIFESCRKVDLLIVSIHMATELSPWPSPKTQTFYRSLIDAGASIVHGHHSHVPQGYEWYNDGLIFYGLGNWCVPVRWRGKQNCDWSLRVDATAALKRSPDAIHPIKCTWSGDGSEVTVKRCSADASDDIMEYLDACNRPLGDSRLLAGLWQENAVSLYDRFYKKWIRGSTAYRATGFDTRSAQALMLHHLFACESHAESIAEATGVLSGEVEDLRTVETAKLARRYLPYAR
ncbi:MAG: CapA family protein [Rubinisphaera brasiliensis]|uniref:CapA family protein n=1 Tax=Rubinisphaera brasiliensis TaxID=119 RepID=UPI00391D5FA5